MEEKATPPPFTYTELEQARWDEARGLMDEQGYQATRIEDYLFLTPCAEEQVIDPNEVFYAALKQDILERPQGGGQHYCTRQELEQRKERHTYRRVFVTKSLAASQASPGFTEGVKILRAESGQNAERAITSVSPDTDHVEVPVSPQQPGPDTGVRRVVVPMPGLSFKEMIAAGLLSPEDHARLQQEPDGTWVVQPIANEQPAETRWQPCTDCPFAGEVGDLDTTFTACTFSSVFSEHNVRVSFMQHEGTDSEHCSGSVTVRIDKGDHGVRGEQAAAGRVIEAIKVCALEQRGPLTGKKWGGLQTVRVCGALSVLQEDIVKPKPGFRRIKNAKQP
ncbi:MAG TPA: hypothetical protein VJ836_03045 [Candidatus Saccharimonadales bacterium]|nr:hypothetical protein [Candidatus Saccharimonadales bacterium]